MKIFDVIMLIPSVPLTLLFYVGFVGSTIACFTAKSAEKRGEAASGIWGYMLLMLVGTAVVGGLLQAICG